MFLVILSAGSAGGWLLYHTRQEAPRSGRRQLPPLVQTVIVRRSRGVERFVGYGSVSADRTSIIRAEVAAVVVERGSDVESGCAVRAAEVVIRLDDGQ